MKKANYLLVNNLQVKKLKLKVSFFVIFGFIIVNSTSLFCMKTIQVKKIQAGETKIEIEQSNIIQNNFELIDQTISIIDDPVAPPILKKENNLLKQIFNKKRLYKLLSPCINYFHPKTANKDKSYSKSCISFLNSCIKVSWGKIAIMSILPPSIFPVGYHSFYKKSKRV